VVENGAERVFAQFELEAQHRRQMEGQSIGAECRDLLVGKIFAFIFVIAMIGTAIYAISAGYPWLSGFLGASVLSSIVWAFVHTKGDSESEGKKQSP